MHLVIVAGQKPNFISAPVALFDIIIGGLDFLAKFFPKQFEVSEVEESHQLPFPHVFPCFLPRHPLPSHQDAAEFGRIGKYYAVESMLVWDPVKEVYVEEATPR